MLEISPVCLAMATLIFTIASSKMHIHAFNLKEQRLWTHPKSELFCGHMRPSGQIEGRLSDCVPVRTDLHKNRELLEEIYNRHLFE